VGVHDTAEFLLILVTFGGLNESRR
jgi:hypothetical protein